MRDLSPGYVLGLELEYQCVLVGGEATTVRLGQVVRGFGIARFGLLRGLFGRLVGSRVVALGVLVMGMMAAAMMNSAAVFVFTAPLCFRLFGRFVLVFLFF